MRRSVKRPCTPLANLETFDGKISTSTIFGHEIAGLLKKKPEDEEY